MTNKALYFFALILVAGLYGCNQSLLPTEENLGIPAGAGKAEYGYNINGQVFDSKTISINFSSASLGPYAEQGAGSAISTVTLFYEFNSGNAGSVEITIPLINPSPLTLPISNTNMQLGANAIAAIDIDSIEPDLFQSSLGGTITITKFDKVNNLVSGVFEMTGTQTHPIADPNNIVTITSGYFNDIPIGQECYGQGSMTATIDGGSFTAEGSGFEEIRANAVDHLLSLTSYGQGSLLKHDIEFFYVPLEIGNYIMNDTIQDLNLEYLDFTKPGESGQASSRNPASNGQITITMCDTANRRISGIFTFSGPDSTGHIVNIAGGQINNVQYVQE